MRAKLLVSIVVLAFGVVATGAQAAGDPVAGRRKATTCLGCHGVKGYRYAFPTIHVPKVGGQHAQYIVSALKEYKSGKRSNPTMQAQASSLSDQDMQDIAAYFEQAGKSGE